MVLGSINGVNFASADTNVGIGTTAPGARLHIAVNSGNILLGNAGCASGYAGIGFGSSLSGCTNYSVLGNGTNTIINRPTGGTITFRENDSVQMTINSGGGVVFNGIVTLAFFVFFIGKVLESRRQPAVVGGDAIVGAVGQVREDLAPEGLVFVKGALWKATAPSPIQAGSTVRVVSRKGLELQVTPENGQTAPKEGA